MDWPERIRRRLDDGGPMMVYQPIRGLPGLEIIGYEALARFPEPLDPSIPDSVTDDARHGYAPDVWFAQADVAGLRLPLELAAIERALSALPDVDDGQYISVNAAPVTLASRQLRRILRRVDRRRVMVELTEQIHVADHEALCRVVSRVRDDARIGTEVPDPRRPRVRFALDDVGAGHNSLQLVQDLAHRRLLDAAKLDRWFARGIHLDPMRRSTASHIVDLGDQGGFAVVAEGIESPHELATVIAIGCTAAQGYLDDEATGLTLGRPGPLPGRESVVA